MVGVIARGEVELKYKICIIIIVLHRGVSRVTGSTFTVKRQENTAAKKHCRGGEPLATRCRFDQPRFPTPIAMSTAPTVRELKVFSSLHAFMYITSSNCLCNIYKTERKEYTEIPDYIKNRIANSNFLGAI